MGPRKFHDFIEDLRIRLGGAKRDAELDQKESGIQKLERLMQELEFISFNGQTREQVQKRLDKNRRKREGRRLRLSFKP